MMYLFWTIGHGTDRWTARRTNEITILNKCRLFYSSKIISLVFLYSLNACSTYFNALHRQHEFSSLFKRVINGFLVHLHLNIRKRSPNRNWKWYIIIEFKLINWWLYSALRSILLNILNINEKYCLPKKNVFAADRSFTIQNSIYQMHYCLAMSRQCLLL